MAAPLEEGEPSSAELLAVEEAKRDGGWVDGALVSALVDDVEGRDVPCVVCGAHRDEHVLTNHVWTDER